METAIYLSFVTASLSFTVTEAKIFLPLREWLKGKNRFLAEQFSCGYCFGHWAAFALVALYQPKLLHSHWLLDYFFTALIVTWFSAFQWVLLCLFVQKAGK